MRGSSWDRGGPSPGVRAAPPAGVSPLGRCCRPLGSVCEGRPVCCLAHGSVVVAAPLAVPGAVTRHVAEVAARVTLGAVASDVAELLAPAESKRS